MELDERDRITEVEAKKRTICPLPWRQVHVTTKGQVYPCCMWTGESMGNIRHLPLGLIWEGKSFNKLRKEFSNNEKPQGCEKCWLAENTGMRSPRWYSCRKYLEELDYLDKKEGNIEYWDIRFSNICNLACRMCGPESSTRWYEDGKKLFGEAWVEKVKKEVNTPNDSKRLLNTLLENLEKASEIYFVGGEPLIMVEHYRVLEEILRRGLSGIYLRYNTNLTTLGPNDRALKLWKKLLEQGNEIEVGASIDGIGDLAEYIRYGCTWSVVEDNLRKMREAGIPTKMMPTVSLMNVYWMPEFLDWCIERGYDRFDWTVALPNFVVYPRHYDIRILPEEDKDLVYNKCAKYLEKNKNSEYWELQQNFIEPILVRVRQKDLELSEVVQENSRLDFHRVTEQLDSMRNQDWKKVNPQFKLS